MKLASLIAPLSWAIVGCSQQQPEQSPQDAQPVEAPIPMIEGHEIHNQLAGSRIGLRNLYLSRILRGMGEDCMVVNRSMYQGYAEDLGASLWSAHCEIGTDWMVSVNKDGSGSILGCGEMDQLRKTLEGKAKAKLEGLNCWERFED